MTRIKSLLTAILAVACFTAIAQETVETGTHDIQQDSTVADLTQSAQELNRDLLILEEELLFPTHTQVAVFVSMDVGNYFRLDSLKLKIDDELVASYLYTEQQVKALFQGGVQRLYLGNLKSGDHEISAFFTGQGPNGRDYKRGATITLNKGAQAKQLELMITDSTAKQQPEFEIREW